MVRKKLKFDEDAPTPVSFEEDSTQPVYEHPPSKYNAERIIKILLQPNESKICRETYCSDPKCIICR